MTDEIERLRAVVEAATPGPWHPCPPRAESISGPASHGKRIAECDPDGHNAKASEDARAIAALRTLAPELLDAARLVQAFAVPPEWRECHGCGECRWCDAFEANKRLRARIREVLGE